MSQKWNAGDAASLRDFIAKNPKFLPQLRDRIPKCHGETMEHRAVTGSEAQGARDLLEYLENVMLSDQKAEPKSPFVPHEN